MVECGETAHWVTTENYGSLLETTKISCRREVGTGIFFDGYAYS
jgi:hypothetical protein